MADAGTTLAPGTILDGRYRLVRTLGQGGMGMVFQGVHLRLDRPVAIKVLRPEYANTPEFQVRFEREARAASIIQSPHAVRVFDVATSPEGTPYMVMELLSGNDLGDELARRGPLPIAEVADWIVQACAALQEAHDNRIVHRDIKPANIFLAETSDGRIAKLLDFGISKFDDPTFQTLTKAVDTLGTPTFMSPEQIRGLPLDPRTDIWSLGIVLYRVLSNRWPFGGKNEAAYMAGVLADPPLPFELARPDLSYEIANVIMRALEKNTRDRYASAVELAAALTPFGSGKVPLVALRSAITPPRAPNGSSPDITLRDDENNPPTTVRDGGPLSEAGPTAPAVAVAVVPPPRELPLTPRPSASSGLRSDAATPGAHEIDVLAHGPTIALPPVTPARPVRSPAIAIVVAITCVIGFGGAGFFYATKYSKSHTSNPSLPAQVATDTAATAADPALASQPPPPSSITSNPTTTPTTNAIPASTSLLSPETVDGLSDAPHPHPSSTTSSSAKPKIVVRRDGAKTPATPLNASAAPPTSTTSVAPAVSKSGISRDRHE